MTVHLFVDRLYIRMYTHLYTPVWDTAVYTYLPATPKPNICYVNRLIQAWTIPPLRKNLLDLKKNVL